MSNGTAPHAGPNELLDLLQDAGRIGLLDWRVPSGSISLSRRFLEMCGLHPFDGRYDSWTRAIFREDRVRVAAEYENAFAQRLATADLEFRVNGSGGRLQWIEVRHSIFYDADGSVARVIGAATDITERKSSTIGQHAFRETLESAVRERTRELREENEARQKAEAALRQAQKMEAIGQLTGGIAHDFNNLLTVVVGGLESIGRQVPALGDSPAAFRIGRAREIALLGVQRAIALTSRLLAFSRQQPLMPVILDVNQRMASMRDFLRRTLGEHVALETVLSAGLWRAQADPGELENALLNLALNSRDAMGGGGKLTIETANCYLDDAYVAALSEPMPSGQYVMIAVTDTGTGMDAETVARAFDPFFTTKDVGKGTGLGLSQVYGFVRQSGGHVRIYSEVGEGTTVKVYLPRHLGDDKAQPSAPVGEYERGSGSETILVVEDDEPVRLYTVETLQELGYHVLPARNGVDALEVLRCAGIVDLLFTDVVMPGGMNGRQLAGIAQQQRPGIKVLFTTGYTRNAIVHHGRLDPGVDLIGKPFTSADLARKIRDVLDRPHGR